MSTEPTPYNLLEDTALSDGANIIRTHELGAEVANQAWSNAVKDAVASACTDKDDYLEYRKKFEEEILQKMLDAGDSTVKKGYHYPIRWNYTKVCKNSTYRSNKSTIAKAIEAGVPLLDTDGNPVAKSALSKETRIAFGGKPKSRTIPKVPSMMSWEEEIDWHAQQICDAFSYIDPSARRKQMGSLFAKLAEVDLPPLEEE